MPTVGQPQIFHLPQETPPDLSGFGTLLGALLRQYRQGGAGTYQSPLGARIPTNPQEAQFMQQQAAMTPGATYTPDRLRFLGPLKPDLSQITNQLGVQKLQSEIGESQAKTKNYAAQAGFYDQIASGKVSDVPVVRDETTGEIRPARPDETPTMILSHNKSGSKLSAMPENALSPEQAANRESFIAQEKERAKQAANIPSAIRSVKVHLDQFQKAFPSGNRSQALQTAIGASKSLGAKLGIGITPEQRAVLKTLPLATIGLVRVSGALGRVSNQELDAAAEALNQSGLTDEERILTARNLAQQYLARVEPKDLQRALQENPELGGILKDFGLDVASINSTSLSSKAKSLVESYRTR